ncbi:transcription termination/antitermination protein NusG [Fuerstiella marisgermanici]|uniref:Transcriptional activator n=1 Tax=Fuerstiella marisgermanici TaxID=1891926 RepID=A0A1P8WN60_9PLAN|nr:UpxY family transcription antiterminator [Fuerstiella marisgermanici]APZ95503.1 transcriptional activator [Fuerstiella marisgermanici]
MPILDQEPDLYPDNLLSSPEIIVPDGNWFAIYTLSRREKDLMRRLRTQKIAHYGPMVAKRTRSPAGRMRTSYAPLFTGYVFVCASEEDRYNTVATGCVSKCIPVVDPEILVKDLQQIRTLEEHGEDLQAEVRPTVGQMARIVRGPLKDRELVGTITQVKNQHRLTVLVNFLQQGASITVDEADIELI